MEWNLLIILLTKPELLADIGQIIPAPGAFLGRTDGTSHSLIYEAMFGLKQKGQPMTEIMLMSECERLRPDYPPSPDYSAVAIMELEFQTWRDWQIENLRIEVLHCADKVLERYKKRRFG